jgi:hypothetical protein
LPLTASPVQEKAGQRAKTGELYSTGMLGKVSKAGQRIKTREIVEAMGG